MFCGQCGEKWQEGWKVCPKCGWKAGDVEEAQYVLFPQIRGKKREKINSVFRVIHKIVILVTVVMVAAHIYGEFQEAENYKALLYVMRFICMCGPYFVLEFVVEEIKWMMLLQKNQVSATCPAGAVMGTEFVYILMGVIAGIMFINPSAGQEWEMMAAVVDDSVVDYLITMKGAIILLILAAFIKYMQGKWMEPKQVRKS